jgi:hypothetical protein
MFGQGSHVRAGEAPQPPPPAGGGTIEVGGRSIRVGDGVKVTPLGPGEVEITTPPAPGTAPLPPAPRPLAEAAAHGASRDR